MTIYHLHCALHSHHYWQTEGRTAWQSRRPVSCFRYARRPITVLISAPSWRWLITPFDAVCITSRLNIIYTTHQTLIPPSHPHNSLRPVSVHPWRGRSPDFAPIELLSCVKNSTFYLLFHFRPLTSAQNTWCALPFGGFNIPSSPLKRRVAFCAEDMCINPQRRIIPTWHRDALSGRVFPDGG